MIKRIGAKKAKENQQALSTAMYSEDERTMSPERKESRRESACSMLDITEVADRWIVDSGASQHVTNFGRRGLIKGFSEKIKEKILKEITVEGDNDGFTQAIPVLKTHLITKLH